jgi:hypothetical protein
MKCRKLKVSFHFCFAEGGSSGFEVGLKMLMSMPSTKEIKTAVSNKIGKKTKGKQYCACFCIVYKLIILFIRLKP